MDDSIDTTPLAFSPEEVDDADFAFGAFDYNFAPSPDSVLGLNDSEPAEPAPFPYGYVMGGLTILVFLVALWAIGVWLCYRCRRSRRNKQATQPLIIYSHAATPFVSGATTPTIPQTHLGVPSQSMHSMRARNGTTQWVNSPHTQQSMNAAEASAASASTWPNRTSMQSYTPLDTPGAKGSSTGGDSSLAEVYKAAFPTKAGCTTFAHTAMGLLAAPGPEASSECKQEYVQYQIDSLVGQVLLDGLVLQEGFRTRLLGGQAVVQFANDKRTEFEYAMKFYLSQSAFKDEVSLYTDRGSKLRNFLPEVRNIVGNEDEAFVDAHGAPMPPCIIMEKGESLDLWSARNKSGLDMITGLQVIHHIAERLEDLHTAGFCHRDLKPGNVMWLPRQNRWTLIDFGCVAALGDEARMGYSLAYAAPEIIHAVRAGQDKILATDKLDAWSLGVLAVELLTNKAPFNLLEGKEKVMDRIVGVEALPWEDPQTAPALLRRFGHFRVAVMNLLARNPEERPSMPEFRQQCNRVLMHTTKG